VSSTHGSSSNRDGEGPEPDHEPERQPDDLDLEVSALMHEPTLRPSGGRSRLAPGNRGVVPWYRQSVLVPRLVVATAIVVLLALVLLVAAPVGPALGVLGALRSQPTPTPTTFRFVFPTSVPATPTPSPYPTPTLVSVPALGPVPADCPPGSLLVDFDPAASIPGVGGPDVWFVAGALVGAHGKPFPSRATAALGELSPSDYTPFGWPVQMLVLVKPDFTQTITIVGRDLRTGYALWLAGDQNETATPTFTIDPSQPHGGTSDGQWSIWFGVLYLPGAGCYTLQASWTGGSWTVHFAAGR
jgi:hypothetical protein